MQDTSFLILREKRDRRSAAHGFDEEGRLIKRVTWSSAVVPERPEDMTYESGAGLWSTIDDYLNFARLFVGGGEVDGVRLLFRKRSKWWSPIGSQKADVRMPDGLAGTLSRQVEDLDMGDLAQLSKGIGLGVWGPIETLHTLASASLRVAWDARRNQGGARPRARPTWGNWDEVSASD